MLSLTICMICLLTIATCVNFRGGAVLPVASSPVLSVYKIQVVLWQSVDLLGLLLLAGCHSLLVSTRFEEPLANLLNEQHRTVKEQLEQLRMKKSSIKPPQEMEKSKPQNEKPLQSLVLDSVQRKRLQQQMQQVIKCYLV